MIDPVTPATLVLWRGKTYPLQLTTGALASASGQPGVPRILEGGPDSMFTKPEFFQRGVLLYALVHRKFPDATLDECIDAVVGEKSAYYGELLSKALSDIVPAIQKLHAAEAKNTPPLEESSSGDECGPALESTSELEVTSSGS